MRGYLPLIQKDSVTHMDDLAVYVKEGLSFAWNLFLEKICGFSLMFLTGFTSLSALLLFLYGYFFSLLCMVFDSILSDIDEVLSISPSANVFVFGDFNVRHKDWLTCSGGTDRPGELCYNFSFSNDLTQIINIPTWISDCDSHGCAFLDLFLTLYF